MSKETDSSSAGGCRMDNRLLLRYCHRIPEEVADDMDGATRKKLHARLAEYFARQPLYLTDTSNQGNQHSETVPNARKLAELPYHLAQAGEIEELRAVITDFDFAVAKCRLNRSDDWAEDFRLADGDGKSRDYRIWESFVKSNRHILRRGNEEWPAHKILLQLAIEHADDSPVTIAAEQFLAAGKCTWAWLRKERRDKHAGVSPCVMVFEGHSGTVNGLLELHNGNILSWSDDGTLRIWDTRSGRCLHVLKGHYEPAAGGATDNGTVVSWSGDTLYLRDGSSGACTGRITGTGGPITGAMVLPGRQLLSWSADDNLRLWDLESGSCRAVMEGCATFLSEQPLLLADGRLLTAAVQETIFRLWDSEAGELREPSGENYNHFGERDQILELPDGNLLHFARRGGIGHSRHSLTIRNHRDGSCLKTLQDIDADIEKMQLLPDGRLLTLTRSGSLQLWDLARTVCLLTINGPAEPVTGVLTDQQHRLITWSDQERDIRVWDTSGRCIRILKGHDDPVSGIRILPCGRLLSWSGKRENEVRLWDPSTGRCLHTMQTPSFATLKLLDGSIWATWGADAAIRLWNSNDGSLVAVMTGHTGQIFDLIRLADGRLLSLSGDGTLRIWDSATGRCRAVLIRDSLEQAAELQPAGLIVAWSIYAKNRGIRVWNEDGAFLSDYDRGELFSAPEEVWRACLPRRQKNDQAGLACWSGTAILGYRYGGRISRLYWQAPSTVFAKYLFEDGSALVRHLRDDLLHPWMGNRRATLADLGKEE